MILFLSALITLAVFAYLAYPILRPKPEAELQEDSAREGLLLKKDSLYSTIKELEFDYQIGSLSEKDFKELEEKYKEKAISLLKEMDSWEKGEFVGEEIEKQVRALRQMRSKPVEEEVERQVQSLRQTQSQPKARFCPHCGARLQEGDRFCSQCGANTSVKNNDT